MVRAQIRLLSPSERTLAAEMIAQEVECDPHFIAAKTVAVFMPLGDEPPIREAVGRWATEKRIVVPRVEGDDMRFFDFDSSDMARGSFGIDEPQMTAECPPEQIEVMIVPAVALARNGARMGRGRGYYDRYLGAPAAARIYKIGTCFACQLVEQLIVEPHDVLMDRVVAR